MTTQIPLGLTTLLSYSPQNFVVHDGVEPVVSYLTDHCRAEPGRFSSIVVQSKERMGKTHLSIYLSDLLAKQGAMVRLIDAQDFLVGVELLHSKRLSAKSVVIVDDLHLALPSLSQIEGESATSGAFVSLVELLRVSMSKVIFLSSLPISSFEGNPHVHSRLAESTSFTLKFPSERHFVSVVGSMLVQRGISLSKRSVAYLGKVLPKDFGQIENYIANLDYLSSILGEDITMQTIKDAV